MGQGDAVSWQRRQFLGATAATAATLLAGCDAPRVLDGGFTGMFMFVADRVANLSSGTLYAAKWNQTSPAGTNGGSAKLTWIRLGHGSDRQIRRLVENGITFSDIFEVSNTDPATRASQRCTPTPGPNG